MLRLHVKEHLMNWTELNKTCWEHRIQLRNFESLGSWLVASLYDSQLQWVAFVAHLSQTQYTNIHPLPASSSKANLHKRRVHDVIVLLCFTVPKEPHNKICICNVYHIPLCSHGLEGMFLRTVCVFKDSSMSPTSSATSVAFYQKRYRRLNPSIDYAMHLLFKYGC
jgi:hypothetical protein